MSVTKSFPGILVSVTNILGRAVKNVDFGIAISSVATEKNKKQLFTEHRQVVAKSSDNTVFELSLLDNLKERGFYTLKATVVPNSKDIGLLVLNDQFDVKFSSEVEVADLSVASADREQSSPKLLK